jgi:hypothetical protein
MEGHKSDSPEKGVISRAFEHIFEAISVTTGVKYLALISYLEIYNEQIRDLLLPNDKITACALNLKESPTEGVTVPGLTSHPVHNASECEHFLSLGSKNRIIGATLMNQNSSRSHSIFTISIEQITNINNNESLRKGKLNLVDLAGSERQAKTGATGDRLKEATKINLSLSALGNVISALVDGKAKHIPYRDSKLTRLLQDSLGGNTRTLMIACVSPSSRDYVETLSTLRYANRAKNIHNKPIVNEDPKDTMLRQYQEEIERLKNLLGSQQLKIEEVSVVEEEEPPDLDARRDRLIQEYQQEMEKLKNLHENEEAQQRHPRKDAEGAVQQRGDSGEDRGAEEGDDRRGESQRPGAVRKEEAQENGGGEARQRDRAPLGEDRHERRQGDPSQSVQGHQPGVELEDGGSPEVQTQSEEPGEGDFGHPERVRDREAGLPGDDQEAGPEHQVAVAGCGEDGEYHEEGVQLQVGAVNPVCGTAGSTMYLLVWCGKPYRRCCIFI